MSVHVCHVAATLAEKDAKLLVIKYKFINFLKNIGIEGKSIFLKSLLKEVDLLPYITSLGYVATSRLIHTISVEFIKPLGDVVFNDVKCMAHGCTRNHYVDELIKLFRDIQDLADLHRRRIKRWGIVSNAYINQAQAETS